MSHDCSNSTTTTSSSSSTTATTSTNTRAPNVISEREEVGFFWLNATEVNLFVPQQRHHNQQHQQHQQHQHQQPIPNVKDSSSNSQATHLHGGGENEMSHELPKSVPVGRWIDVHLEKEKVFGLPKDGNDNMTTNSTTITSTTTPSEKPPPAKKRRIEYESDSSNDYDFLQNRNNDESRVMENDVGTQTFCHRCNLLLHVETSMLGGTKTTISLQEENMPSFTGLLPDVTTCSDCTSSSRSSTHDVKKCTSHQRSDASLLIGMIASSRAMGTVRFEKFQILLLEEEDNQNSMDDDDEDEDDSEDEENKKEEQSSGIFDKPSSRKMPPLQIVHGVWGYIHTMRVAMCITISLPYLERISKLAATMPNEEKEPTTTTSNTNTNTTTSTSTTGRLSRKRTIESLSFSTNMPPCVQLLFSMVRCDWTNLKQHMHRLCHASQRKRLWEDSKEQPSVFPSHLSLEELYKRIQGVLNSTTFDPRLLKVNESTHSNLNDSSSSSSTSIEERKVDNSDGHENNVHSDPPKDLSTRPSRNTIDLILMLSGDLLACITSYLRAKSHHMLRNSCKYLYHNLRAIVPGMKLRLYEHQIRSLHWMRQREDNEMLEDDAIQWGPDNSTVDPCLCGDLYRSISSGTTVSMITRAESEKNLKDKKDFWHVNTMTGDALSNGSDYSKRTMAKVKKVARGGLLCDDPGLGKTITVLSLILQTFGQSTATVLEEDDTGTEMREGMSDKVPHTGNDDVNEIFDSFWRAELTVDLRIEELKGLIHKKLRKMDRSYDYFEPPFQRYYDHIDESRKKALRPICFRDILGRIQKNKYGKEFQHFVNDVNLIFR